MHADFYHCGAMLADVHRQQSDSGRSPRFVRNHPPAYFRTSRDRFFTIFARFVFAFGGQYLAATHSWFSALFSKSNGVLGSHRFGSHAFRRSCLVDGTGCLPYRGERAHFLLLRLPEFARDFSAQARHTASLRCLHPRLWRHVERLAPNR